MNTWVNVFVWTYAFIFSKSRMAMSFGRWIFKCIRICQLFYKEFYNFTLPPVVYEHSRWSISLPIRGMASLFSFRHLKRWVIGIHYSFNLHLSNHIWPWAFFMYFFLLSLYLWGWNVWGNCMVRLISEITILHFLMCNGMKAFISYLLSGFKIVSGGRVSPVPSWPK